MFATPRPENPNIHVGLGEDPRLTVVAFSGAGVGLLLRPFDFMDVTGTMRYSRIFLRDPKLSWFQLGITEEEGDFEAVMRTLRGHLDELGAEKVMTVGTSMGGYAALLAGHVLNADFVHAFSPQTYLDPGNIGRFDDLELGARGNLAAVYDKLGRDAEALDLRRALGNPNGRTRYFVHVCAGRPLDLRRAEHVEGVPQVHVLRYPCTVHNVLIGMAHNRFLRTALTLEEQEGLVARHAEVFGGMRPSDPAPRRRMDTALGEPMVRVGKIVRSVSRERLGLQEIMDCKDLLASLSLDSMNLLEIIVALETEFGIEVDPESVMAEDFRTVASILAVVWAAPGAE